MNAATLFVLAVVVVVVAIAAYGTYRMFKNRDYCADCPGKGRCNSNPINCTIRER